MGRLFGTDGVRGVANTELTPELAFRLGRAGAAVLARMAARPRILVGRDTRISGSMLEAALIAGITSVGADALVLGVIPTPGVAYLTKLLRADAGVMISASHNPVEDNGIKFFAGDGFKLPDEVEDDIETLILDLPVRSDGTTDDGLARPTSVDVGRVIDASTEIRRYVDHALATVDIRFDGLKVVVDSANGAASTIAPEIYACLGAEVVSINCSPDGTNINDACGSTHPEALRAAVIAHGAHIGVAHDGDSDRVLAVDENGDLVDGDHIMAICGLEMIRSGELESRTIVATPYSNLGLTKAFEDAGGGVIVAKNGDRYVLEEMRKSSLPLGGEQSGHIIFLEHNTTGDGIVTALQLMRSVVWARESLSKLAACMTTFPQVLSNVRVTCKERLDASAPVWEAVRGVEEALAGRGRVFVRASGTEPIVRVMVEGPDRDECERFAALVADVITAEVG